jgi:type IV pilus assembly protein PilE
MSAEPSERTGSATMFSKQRGITLIELITVSIVIGILLAVAIPSYRSYLIRTQRTEAKTALLNLRAAQEKFYLQNNSYTTVAGLELPSVSETGLYDIRVELASGNQAYTAFAEPKDGRAQKEDKRCLTLSLTDVGRKGASGPGGTDYCWR